MGRQYWLRSVGISGTDTSLKDAAQTLALAHKAATDPARCGGKGSTLARLLQAGFPVPQGFVVTAKTLSAFVATLPACTAEHILAAPLPDALLHSIQEQLQQPDCPSDSLWAVRSSARAEDMEQASFAGQYETVLGVQGIKNITEALKTCWASFYADRADVYQKKQGISRPGGAVVIQRLIDARVAGVGFGRHPVSGECTQLLLNANYGLGETVVGGLVTPDSFVLDKKDRKVLESSTGSKAWLWQWNKRTGEVDKKPCSQEQRGTLCLQHTDLQALLKLNGRLEAFVQNPVDFEWAFEGDKLYLLQSRAITTKPAQPIDTIEANPPPGWQPELNSKIHGDFPLYSNGNISEVLPGCITPLSWSYIGPTLEHAFRKPPEELGVAPDLPDGSLIMGYFFARPYLNISYFLEVARRTPGATPDTVYEEFVGATEGKPTPALFLKDLSPQRLPKLLRVLNTARKKRRSALNELATMSDYYDSESRTLAQNNLSNMTLAQLLAHTRLTEQRLWPAQVHIWISQFAVINFDLLRRLSKAWLHDEDGATAASLVSGIGSLPSADPAFHIYELSRLVLQHEKVRDLFDNIQDDRQLLAKLYNSRSTACRGFVTSLNAFLADFGHRAVCEAELRNPNWREAPEQVLALIRNYLGNKGASPADLRVRQEAAQQQALDRALQSLNAVQRLIFNKILSEARTFIAAREEMKNKLILLSALTRQYHKAIRQNMLQQGLLANEDDVFFLVKEELDLAADAKLTAEEITAIVTRRRKEFDRCQTLKLPRLIEGKATWLTEEALHATGNILTGIACSPGVVEGTARVILDPRRDSHLKEGEILVAPITDAGWTPLFLQASALVVNVGGLLSHGSIVAREYGLPAVVNVSGATQRINTGDRIRVDGSKGRVHLLGETTEEVEQ